MGTSGAPASNVSITYNYGTTTNNGNLQSTSYAGGGLSYTQTFGYDELNRLTTSQEGASWSQTNSYDKYGNRSIVGGGLSFTASNNRITGWSYDAAGNLLNDGAHGYTLDAENKISKVDGVSAYVYDGDGQRVRKLVNENLRFVYGIGGQQIAEFDGGSGALKKEYVYGARGKVATIEPTAVNANGTRYTTADHLGSPRLVTDSSAGIVSRHDYMPFGEELFNGGRTVGMGYGTTDGIRQKFTSKERDNETGLDYFLARYYSATQGRFTSVDPIHFQAEMMDDPQRFNLYAYVRNNPLKFIDPEGEAIALSGDKDERARQLQALQEAAGAQAGAYLYEKQGSDGKYYVEIYTNGPDGKGPKFEEINEVAGEFNAIIIDKQVVTIDFDKGTVRDDHGDSQTLSRTDRYGGNAAVTGYFKGQLMIKMLDPAKSDLGYLPGEVMSDQKDNMLTASVTLAHELGHARYRMTGYRQRGTSDANEASLRLENKVRKLQHPEGPTRKYHNPPRKY